MNWQPIATAPRDRRIILWYPRMFGTGCAVGGRWETQKSHVNPMPFWTCDMARTIGVLQLRACPPTHWCEIEGPK